MRRATPLLFLSLLSLLSLSCASDDSAARGDIAETRYCQSPMDCDEDETCLKGVCGRECLWDEDCGDPNHFVCRQYACEPASVLFPDSNDPDTVQDLDAGEDLDPDLETTPCEKDLDCKALNLVCIEGGCDKDCDEDEDCADPALYCYAQRCFPIDAEPDPGDEVVDPPDSVDPEKPYGSPCETGSECEGEWCVQNMLLQQKTCTKLCGGDGDSYACPGLDVCVGPLLDQDGQSRWVCVANDAGSQNCAACSSGLTLTNAQGNCICTVKCPDAGKCPTNSGCAPVMVGGIPTPVCVPVGQICDPNDVNTSPCYGLCLPRDNSGLYACSIKCDTNAACPQGYTCHAEVYREVVVEWCIPL
jgi:hypothetical protein